MRTGRAERIHQRRLALKLAPAELAAKVGVSRQAVLKWESDDTVAMTAENLFALAAVLGVTAHWLHHGYQSSEDIEFLRDLGSKTGLLDGDENDAEVLQVMEPRLVYLINPASASQQNQTTDRQLTTRLLDLLEWCDSNLGPGTMASMKVRKDIAEALDAVGHKIKRRLPTSCEGSEPADATD